MLEKHYKYKSLDDICLAINKHLLDKYPYEQVFIHVTNFTKINEFDYRKAFQIVFLKEFNINIHLITSVEIRLGNFTQLINCDGKKIKDIIKFIDNHIDFILLKRDGVSYDGKLYDIDKLYHFFVDNYCGVFKKIAIRNNYDSKLKVSYKVLYLTISSTERYQFSTKFENIPHSYYHINRITKFYANDIIRDIIYISNHILSPREVRELKLKQLTDLAYE
jgi:hypothetical protein